MINPGLLTASTSNADHFGMSADCLCCVSIVVLLLWFCAFERVFPLAATEGTRRGAHSAHRRAQRSGALAENQELRGWVSRLRWKREGKAKLNFSPPGIQTKATHRLNRIGVE